MKADEFAKGYHEATKRIQQELARQVRKNNGANTWIDVLNAWNGLTTYIHEEERFVRAYFTDNHQEPSYDEINELLVKHFPNVQFQIVKGGF